MKIYRHGEPSVVLDRGWVDDPRLSFGTLGVLVVLHALWSAGEGLSYEVLLERAEATRTDIRQALDELERAGYVVCSEGRLVLTSPYERLVADALNAVGQRAGRE